MLRIRIAVTATAAALAAAAVGSAVAAPATESVYAGGRTFQINTNAAVVFDASAGLLQAASPMYVIAFPVAPGTSGPITLPSGYQPQNNGLPSPFPYHDHILTAAPGTPGYGAPLRVVVLQYTWAYAYSPSFAPLTSVGDLPAAESDGKLAELDPGAADPYQLWTTTVLIRPIVP
jgi:hypothetical protein